MVTSQPMPPHRGGTTFSRQGTAPRRAKVWHAVGTMPPDAAAGGRRRRVERRAGARRSRGGVASRAALAARPRAPTCAR